MVKKRTNKNQIVIYQSKNGGIELRGDFARDTIWATQAQIAQLFNVTSQNVTLHLNNIYKEKELKFKATCKDSLQVQIEGNRKVKRKLRYYNLDAIIAVGYRINSVMGTNFRIWATKTLREYITKGFAINKQRIAVNYAEFQKAIENIKQLLPASSSVDRESVLELVSAFADTWLSLEAYDKDDLIGKGETKKSVDLTAKQLHEALVQFKNELQKNKTISKIFALEKQSGSVDGIVGNIMQSFGGKQFYSTVEEKAAHLLYFMVKNHPFTDGNKRCGAFAFAWFLKKAGLLESRQITSPALTALTIIVAESAPKQKEKIIRLILQLLKK